MWRSKIRESENKLLKGNFKKDPWRFFSVKYSVLGGLQVLVPWCSLTIVFVILNCGNVTQRRCTRKAVKMAR